MIEALTFPFMQRALAAGVLVALLASYYGVFVVQRGLSFLGSGLAHAAFGGVALGLQDITDRAGIDHAGQAVAARRYGAATVQLDRRTRR